MGSSVWFNKSEPGFLQWNHLNGVAVESFGAVNGVVCVVVWFN